VQCVTVPSFSVRLPDLDRLGNIHREWELPVPWLNEALDGTEASACAQAGRMTVDFLKQGADVIVRGNIHVRVQLPCARTLEPAIYDLNPGLFVVLRQAPSPALTPGRGERRRRQKPGQEPESEGLLDEADAALDCFEGEEIAIDRFIREQILLDLPMFPLVSRLRSQDAPAMRPPSHGAAPGEQRGVDPRLLPLQAIAEKLKSKN
jgi:uncharacterized metal-binding protein YceD (DUF177 family)